MADKAKYFIGLSIVVCIGAAATVVISSDPSEPKAIAPKQELVDLSDPISVSQQPLTEKSRNIVPVARLGVGRMETSDNGIINANRRYVPFVNGNVVSVVDTNTGQASLSFTGFVRRKEEDAARETGEIIPISNGGDVMLVPTMRSEPVANATGSRSSSAVTPAIFAVRKGSVVQLSCPGNSQTDGYALRPDGRKALIWRTRAGSRDNYACLVDTWSGRVERREVVDDTREPIRGSFVHDGEITTTQFYEPSANVNKGSIEVEYVPGLETSQLNQPNEYFDASGTSIKGTIVAATKRALWTRSPKAQWQSFPFPVEDGVVASIRVSPDGSRALVNIVRQKGEQESVVVQATVFVDTANGSILWASPDWSSGRNFEYAFAKHVLLVQPVVSGQAFALSYETGKLLWHSDSGIAPWAEDQRIALACFDQPTKPLTRFPWQRDCTQPLAKRKNSTTKTQVQIEPRGLVVFKNDETFVLETDLNVTHAEIGEDQTFVLYSAGGNVYRWEFESSAVSVSVSTTAKPFALVQYLSTEHNTITIARTDGTVEFVDDSFHQIALLDYRKAPIKQPDSIVVYAAITADHTRAVVSLGYPNGSGFQPSATVHVVDLTSDNALFTDTVANGTVPTMATLSRDGNIIALWNSDSERGDLVLRGPTGIQTVTLDAQVVSVQANSNGFVVSLAKRYEEPSYMEIVDGIAGTPSFVNPLGDAETSPTDTAEGVGGVVALTQPTQPQPTIGQEMSARSKDGRVTATFQYSSSRFIVNDTKTGTQIEIEVVLGERPTDVPTDLWPFSVSLTSVAISDDGSTLATTGSGVVWIFNRQGALIAKRQAAVLANESVDDLTPLTAITFSPNGKILALIIKRKLILYSTTKLQVLAEITEQTNSVTFSADGSLLYTDATIYGVAS
jgi:hypothetical protein